MATKSPPLSRSDSQPQALSQWLDLMLAEIAAKRAALEHARAEEARRRAEHATAVPQDSSGRTPPG